MKQKNRVIALTVLAALALGISACSPKIYIVDRQTAFEEEAAGRWPRFEQDLLRNSTAAVPTPFERVPVTAREQRLYNMLNGEMSSGTVTTTAAPAVTKPSPGDQQTSVNQQIPANQSGR